LTSNDLGVKTLGLTSDETEKLRVFLRDYVAGFEELETLLFLVRAPRRPWTAADLATSLNLPKDAIENALGDLSQDLVTREPGADGRSTHRYVPRYDLEPLVELLRRAYDEQRVTVMRLMSANALERVRTAAARRLADAFRVERSKK